jgi:hypothetical protein
MGVIDLARHSWKVTQLLSFPSFRELHFQFNSISRRAAYGDTPTYKRHLAIAYGSAVEAGELLEVAVDAAVVHPEFGNRLLVHNRRSQRLILGLLRKRPEAQS